MQELHSTAAAAGGRFFGGGGVGDRRLRPHNHQQNNQQALKCPRCDSMNTKFCYYNNYNLSQPRHFCKNCRRYWTKGGVLRNVPVGGGCRKSKRSNNTKSKNNNNNNINNHSSSSETAPPSTPTPQPPLQLPERNSNSHSSSESSSLTAVAAATEEISPATSNAALNNKLFLHENANNPNFDGGGGDCGVFSEIGTFTSLMTSTNEALAFGFGNNGSFIDATSFRFGGAQSGSDQLPAVLGGGECEWQQQKVLGIGGDDHHNQEFASGPLLLDQMVPVELFSLQSGKTGNGGCGPLDWQHAAGGSADQGLFDLTNAVDQGYWSHTPWSDQDNPTLFHLP